MKVKVDVDKIDDEFKSLVKPEMTSKEVGEFGVVILKHKLSKFKNKLLMRK